MARSRYIIYDEVCLYFLTSSVVYGLPIFAIPEVAAIVLKSLSFLQSERQVILTAWVIMENHIHFIVRSKELAKKTAEFKSFTARRIIDYLKTKGHGRWLKRFQEQKLAHKADRMHQLWQEGYHPKQIIGDDVMQQKIDYIHYNPVKRGYVDWPEDWRYSSARSYAGLEGMIPVTLYRGRGGS